MSISIVSVASSAPASQGFERVASEPAPPANHATHADVATISDAARQSVHATSVDETGDSHLVDDRGAVVS